MTRPWERAWEGDTYLTSKESFEVGVGGTIVGYIDEDLGKLQFFVDGAGSTGAWVGDKHAWYTMRVQDVDDLITALQYAKLKITKGDSL